MALEIDYDLLMRYFEKSFRNNVESRYFVRRTDSNTGLRDKMKESGFKVYTALGEDVDEIIIEHIENLDPVDADVLVLVSGDHAYHQPLLNWAREGTELWVISHSRSTFTGYMVRPFNFISLESIAQEIGVIEPEKTKGPTTATQNDSRPGIKEEINIATGEAPVNGSYSFKRSSE